MAAERNEIAGALPPELKKLTKLNRLSLSHNKITSDGGVFVDASLRYLHLGHNELAAAPDLSQCPLMVDLQLNDNEITSIPSAYGKLKKLERLDVSPSRADRCPLRCSVNADRASLLA